MRDDDTNTLPELAEDEFFAWADGRLNRMLRIGARLRSEGVRERLSRRASRGAYGWVELRDRIGTGDPDTLSACATRELVFTCVLASVLDPVPSTFEAAATALQHVIGRPDAHEAFRGPIVRLATQVAAIAGARGVVEWLIGNAEVEPDVQWAARADFLLADARAEGDAAVRRRSLDAWWNLCNDHVVRDGLEPFELRLAGDELPEDLFAAMHAPETAGCAVPAERQPLVTIIVPTYNPGASFLGTIESLHRQSWEHLEVLVVDDCSTKGGDLLEQAERMDPRVRIIRAAKNGGAYRARDAGLAAAAGAFVGFLDADDLSHSRRVERQMQPLLADDDLIATISRSRRTTVEGTSTYLGYLPFRNNMSSLLFRRDPVLERLGRFDGVRKGADSEFEQRLTHVFGEQAIRIMPDVLSLVQLTSGSLSRADMRYSWMAGERVSYVNQFRGAHQRIAASEEPDWRRSDEKPLGGWVAPKMLGNAPAERIDVAVLNDWTTHMDGPGDWATVVADLSRASHGPVGLIRGLRPRFSSLRRDLPVDTPWHLVEAERAVWMNWADTTRVNRLIITDPEYLTYLPRGSERGITAERVYLVAEQSMPRTRRERVMAPVDWCEKRVRTVFGVNPIWIAGSEEIAETLRSHGSEVQLAVFGRGSARVQRPGSGIGKPLWRSGAPTLGVVLPSAADGTRWPEDFANAWLPERSDARVVLYDQSGYFGEERPVASGVEVVTGADEDRATFVAGVDALAVDLSGRGLLANSSWIRRAACRGVPVAMHAASGSEFGELVTTFVDRGSRDLLTLLAVDDRLRWERARAAEEALLRIPDPELG